MFDAYDAKSKQELEKHKNNPYKTNIEERTDVVKQDQIYHFNCLTPHKILCNMFTVDLNKIVSVVGKKMLSNKHPLTAQAIECLVSHQRVTPANSCLAKYYNTHQPCNLGDVYGLVDKYLVNKSQYTKYVPWFDTHPTGKDCGFFGPKDLTAVAHRIYRIQNLIYLISKYGYCPTSDDIIEGYIMLNDSASDYRYVLTGGHHRIAVICAMTLTNQHKFDNIIVKLDKKRVPKQIITPLNIKKGEMPYTCAVNIYNAYFNS